MASLVAPRGSVRAASADGLLTTARFESNGWQVVCAQGSIDVATVAVFETQLQNAQRQNDQRSRLVIDLSEVTVFDVAGFASLLTARSEARSRGVQLRLVVGVRAVHLLDALKSCANWLIYRSVVSATDMDDVDAAMRQLMHDEMTAQR
jgi:anti-anti-sigma factor